MDGEKPPLPLPSSFLLILISIVCLCGFREVDVSYLQFWDVVSEHTPALSSVGFSICILSVFSDVVHANSHFVLGSSVTFESRPSSSANCWDLTT